VRFGKSGVASLLEFAFSPSLEFRVHSEGKKSHRTVDIAIHLFFLPEIELQDYDLTGAGIREFVADLGQRLGAVADVVETLRADGWTVKVVANNLEVRHAEVSSQAEAAARLKRLHIEEGTITDIAEWSDQGERLTPT
jgi:hypothetical protein